MTAFLGLSHFGGLDVGAEPAGLLGAFLGLSGLLAPFCGLTRFDFLGLPSRAVSTDVLVFFLGLDGAVSTFMGELSSRVDFLGLASTAFDRRLDFRGLASTALSVLFLVLF